MDNSAVDTLSLHLHCIADAEHGSSIVIGQESPHGVPEVRVENKIKKDLTIIIKWDIKG